MSYIMKYTTLGITLFRKCNANCSICCFESSPKCNESLEVNFIKGNTAQLQNNIKNDIIKE